jgi:hypothetical protein
LGAENEDESVENSDRGDGSERFTREPAEQWCQRLSAEVRAMLACGYTAGELVIVSPNGNDPSIDQVVPRSFTEQS